jgi:protoheme IX farnesyltransferase
VTVAEQVASRAGLADLLDLTKPRLSLLVVLSCAVGMALAPVSPPGWGRAIAAIAATGAVVGGANALNCYRERESDKWMRRTRNRPLPSGRLDPTTALAFGLTLALGGIAVLLWLKPLSGALATLAVATYVLVYTPMKRTSSLCTLVGAVPGAIPPLIGWTAAGGGLDPGAWALFAWMFLWQPPHFLALATLYREDYAAAGMPMFPVKHVDDGTVERQTALWIAALVPIPVLLVPLSRAGTITAVATPLLGLAWFLVAWRGRKTGATTAWARSTFIASILYMGLTLLAFVLDAGSS